MIDAHQLRSFVIRPALSKIGYWSDQAETLLLFTACAESQCGRYLHQLGGGPAHGIFQMEAVTHDDIWRNYAGSRPALCKALQSIAVNATVGELRWNLQYAAAMCRVHYLRVAEPIPDAKDLRGMAEYWKKYYNTAMGAGDVDGFIQAVNRFAR